jgi:hypothetical protein
MSEQAFLPFIEEAQLSDWRAVVEAAEHFLPGSLFRGEEKTEWTLRTSIEREFEGVPREEYEQRMLLHFQRRAQHWLPAHLIPNALDTFAWLGLIQHYGGPTRLLDVTQSLYIALYFAFEAPGNHDRVVWAIDAGWCTSQCAEIIASTEGISVDHAKNRAWSDQAGIVASLVANRSIPSFGPPWPTFRRFNGVLPVEPWKPDVRQVAQQASFLCTPRTRLASR